jgi:hypothetical protein
MGILLLTCAACDPLLCFALVDLHAEVDTEPVAVAVAHRGCLRVPDHHHRAFLRHMQGGHAIQIACDTGLACSPGVMVYWLACSPSDRVARYLRMFFDLAWGLMSSTVWLPKQLQWSWSC